MPPKRPHPDDDHTAMDSKKPRSGPASPAPGANGVAAAPNANIQEQIAKARARAAAVRERLAGMKNGASGNAPSTPSAHSAPAAAAPAPSAAESARKKIEEMKARVAAATARAGGGSEQRTAASIPQRAQQDEGSGKARGGLGIGLHPALMGDVGQDTRGANKTATSNFSTTVGNRRPQPVGRPAELKGKKRLDLSGPDIEELKQNPYYDASLSEFSVIPRNRKSRDLVFNQKGKYIAQAAALRRQAQLEEMKKRIAESARKAGLDEDRSEQAFVIIAPPAMEWWDEGLVDGTEYPDFEDDSMAAEQKLKIITEDSIITRYVQHPVLLQPPHEKNMPAPKPMYMTKREQAKKRRQDRSEVLKEKQAKVRLGLEPPEPPKIKKSNLMRVLGEQAVKDPTAVEARVNREIAERQQNHEEANEERKLTKEERAGKLANNQEKDAAKGIVMNVYRIDSLAYGKHRYQVDMNAKQHALTGITILNPRLNLIIVEGGPKSIRDFQKLMTRRVKWTEIAPAVPREQEKTKMRDIDKEIAEASWLKAEDESGQLRDFTENRCVLVWEGEEKQRTFKFWGSKVCETDGEARRALEKFKMENMWAAAKNWVQA